jgi:hypothetical protein
MLGKENELKDVPPLQSVKLIDAAALFLSSGLHAFVQGELH